MGRNHVIQIRQGMWLMADIRRIAVLSRSPLDCHQSQPRKKCTALEPSHLSLWNLGRYTSPSYPTKLLENTEVWSGSQSIELASKLLQVISTVPSDGRGRPLSANDGVFVVSGRHPPSPAVIGRLQNIQNIFRWFTIMIDNQVLIARGKSY
jgi:hypothetical protein